MITIAEAVKTEIRRRKQPVITWFEVERAVRRLYRERQFDGQPLNLRGGAPTPRMMARIKSVLLDPREFTSRDFIEKYDLRGAVKEDALSSQRYVLMMDLDFPATVCRVAGVSDAQPEDLCCLVDPWCYVSHLSAMQRWGLTNRNPLALHLSRPAKPIWRGRAKDEVRDEYWDLEPGQQAPQPRERVTFPATLRGRALEVFEPNFFGHSIAIPDSTTRIATVGQVFRDTVHEPALCGGMSHVLEIWEEHAEAYLNDIIEAMDALKPSKIALVRAGYILSERLGIKDPRVEAWTAFAERGGSRKLDPQRPFEAAHSKRWMLSLNV